MPPSSAAGSSSNTASKAWKGRLGIKAKISSKRKEECRDWDPSTAGPREKDMDEGGGEETLLGTRKLNTGFLLLTHLYHHAKLQTFTVTVFSLSIAVNKCLYMYSDLKWLGQGTIFQVGKQSVFFIQGCGESCNQACGTSALSMQGALRWPWQLLPPQARQSQAMGRHQGGQGDGQNVFKWLWVAWRLPHTHQNDGKVQGECPRDSKLCPSVSKFSYWNLLAI